MKCYTRTGDKGETCIFGGKLDKHDERIEAIGTVDELNAFLGAAASFSSNKTSKRIIHEIQNDMFTIGAELATVIEKTSKEKVAIESEHVEHIEALIDKLDEQLPKQTKFIIPSGTQASMLLNVARAVARRAERTLVKLDRSNPINPELLKYMNRLSSLLYVLLRFENNRNNVIEKNPIYPYQR